MTQKEIEIMTATLREEYARELNAMKRTKERPQGFTQHTIDDLLAGYADGIRNTLTALRCKGAITIDE